jgi:hypothetical protein
MLKRAQLDALALAVTDAFTAGGATIDDFRHPGGVRDAFQSEFLIHLRAGEPWVRCASTGVKMDAAGRGTYARARGGALSPSPPPGRGVIAWRESARKCAKSPL